MTKQSEVVKWILNMWLCGHSKDDIYKFIENYDKRDPFFNKQKLLKTTGETIDLMDTLVEARCLTHGIHS